VIVSSGVGNRPGPWQASYASSKAAATRLGESLDLELAGTGVRCFVVSPGLVRTGMTDRWPDEMLRFLPEWGDMPEENFKPVSLLLNLLDAIATGAVDDLSGRFLHATDDLEALRAAVAAREEWEGGVPPVTAAARRARTLRMHPAEDGDPLST
jgi:NAD(P)-dependent dehydrogenase (short-subunit alcohol dehydrogenase family)